MFDVKTSKKIIDLAKLQQEIVEREGDSDSDDSGDGGSIHSDSDDSEIDEDMTEGGEEDAADDDEASSSDERSKRRTKIGHPKSMPPKFVKIQEEQELEKEKQTDAYGPLTLLLPYCVWC